MRPSVSHILLVICSGLIYPTLEIPITLQTPLSIPDGTVGAHKDATVLILGGGVAGTIAARTFREQGISDFLILEARDTLGGRMMSHKFGTADNQHTVEVGANWVQGTQTGNGTENPIWALVKKHNVTTVPSHYFTSLTTYDDTGATDYLDLFNKSVRDYARLTAEAGTRIKGNLVDASARSGYSMTGSKPRNYREAAAEYFQFDYEFAQTPEETSWIASSWANNYTFRAEAGGFSEDNHLAIDPRGFSTIIQSEARTFLQSSQLRLNSTVKSIAHSANGVRVTLTDGQSYHADYALCTFSLGVLQNDDVKFQPQLPQWKQEAIHSMTMGTFTKIFLQFPKKFWFDTEMGLYADQERGRYPIWQSLDHPDFLPGSGIIFVTVTGDFSKRVESLPNALIKTEVLSVLQSMFPDVRVPDPLDFYLQRWHADPLYRGSYSNWPASFLSEHHANLRANVEERLWFAGEATSRKYFGYLHGAYIEGSTIALSMVDCIKSGGCIGLEHIERVKNANPYNVS